MSAELDALMAAAKAAADAGVDPATLEDRYARASVSLAALQGEQVKAYAAMKQAQADRDTAVAAITAEATAQRDAAIAARDQAVAAQKAAEAARDQAVADADAATKKAAYEVRSAKANKDALEVEFRDRQIFFNREAEVWRQQAAAAQQNSDSVGRDLSNLTRQRDIMRQVCDQLQNQIIAMRGELGVPANGAKP
jgi:hypothetical protein